MTQPEWTPPPPQPKKQGGGIAKGCLISAAVVVVLGIALIVIFAVAVNDSVDKAQRRLHTTTPQGEQVVISFDEFNQVANGMSLTDVETLIGGPGKVSSQSQIGTDELVNYQWGGEDLGANAVIGFRNGVVFSKTQIGLT